MDRNTNNPFKIEPTEKQSQFITHTQRYGCMSGGYGCVGGETKIFNPVTGKKTRIDKLGEMNWVLSYDPDDNSLHTAPAYFKPKKYPKKQELFRVTTETGKSIITTMKHKFYTNIIQLGSWMELKDITTRWEDARRAGGVGVLCYEQPINFPHYEEISEIKYERTDYYYDLHVPHFNNYFAEGFVNHNSGKTWAGCMRALILSQYPKNVGLIGRLSYREIADTTRKTFFEICPPEYYDDKQGGRWSPTENNLRLINGSEILFRHLDTVSEAELKSLNLGWFFIDQAEEISLPVVRVLMSRLRLNSVPNRYGFFSCNPEPGSWIDTMFKTPFDAETLDRDFFYLDSTTYDNPYNPPEYVEDLKRQFPPEMVKRYVEGSWQVMENVIYSEFDPKVHVVNPFQVPKEWEHIITLDHGMVNPTACLLAVIDYDYNIYIIDEYYSPGIVSSHAKAVKAMVGEQEISLWLIDPSTSSKTREKEGKPFSIMEEYEDYGLYFIPANNQKLAGINRVKEFLKVNPDRRNPITREKGSPRLFIFKNCVNFIWEMKQYKWRKLRSLTQRNAPEEPIDYADHLMDCIYMMIMSRFPPPQKTFDGKSLILPADRVNSNIMSVDNSQTVQADEVLGQFGGSEEL